MGYGCCNEIIPESDYPLYIAEAESIASKVAAEMTEDNYKLYLTRDYYNTNFDWRLIEGANLDSSWMASIALKKGFGLEQLVNS